MPHSWQLPTCSEPTTSSNLLKRDFEGQHQVAESVFFSDSCTEAAVFTGLVTEERSSSHLPSQQYNMGHSCNSTGAYSRPSHPHTSNAPAVPQRNAVLHPAVAFLFKLNLLHFSSAAFQMNLASALLLSSPCFYNRCTLLFNVHRE